MSTLLSPVALEVFALFNQTALRWLSAAALTQRGSLLEPLTASRQDIERLVELASAVNDVCVDWAASTSVTALEGHHALLQDWAAGHPERQEVAELAHELWRLAQAQAA